MKNLVKILIASAFLIIASAGLSACSLFKPSGGGNKEEECTHPISQYRYEYDENNHWHPCTCEHKDTYRGSPMRHTIGADGKCYCGYGIECKVVFKGVSIGEIPSQTVRAGEKFTEPETPVREGYVFNCWKFQYKNSANWNEWDFERAAYASNLELTAFWTKTYTLTFDTTGGEMPEGTDSVQVYKSGEEIAAPVTPVREKFGFKGWSSNPDKYVAYDFEKNNTAESDVTVYAFWEQLYYVDFIHMDGSGETTRWEVKKDYHVYLQGDWMVVLERDNYDHVGWTMVEGSSVAGTPSGDRDIYVTEDVTLYAVWVSAHKITYDCEGGSVQKHNGSGYAYNGYSYNVHVGKTPFEPIAKREGYTFVNWTDDTSTNEPYDFDKELESDVTLYAVWTYYTLTLRIADGHERFGEFYSVGAAGDRYEDRKVTAGKYFSLRLKEKGILGYKFDGWYDDDGQVVSNNMIYSFDMPEKNLILTAKWRVKEEMSNFEFTSDTEKLKITAVIDDTVSEIVVPGYVTEMDNDVLKACTGLRELTTHIIDVYLPKTLTKIKFTGDKLKEEAFAFLTMLTSVTFTQDLTEIPARAFYSCTSLSSITLPQGITSIGEKAFCDCRLTSIVLPEKLEVLGNLAFNGCRIKEIVIPASVKEIGHMCFSTGSSFQSLSFATNSRWSLTSYGLEDLTFSTLVNINYVDYYKDTWWSYDWRKIR